MKIKLVLFTILFGVSLFLISCDKAPQEPISTQPPSIPPEQIVQSFYNWYIDRPPMVRATSIGAST